MQTFWIPSGRVFFTLQRAEDTFQVRALLRVAGLEMPIIIGWHKAQVRACKINARTHLRTEEHTGVFNLQVLPHILVKLVLPRLHQLS